MLVYKFNKLFISFGFKSIEIAVFFKSWQISPYDQPFHNLASSHSSKSIESSSLHFNLKAGNRLQTKHNKISLKYVYKVNNKKHSSTHLWSITLKISFWRRSTFEIAHMTWPRVIFLITFSWSENYYLISSYNILLYI